LERAEILLRLAEVEAAKADLDFLVNSFSDYKPSFRMLSDLYSRRGEFGRAASVLRSAPSLIESDFYTRSRLQELEGNFDQAEQTLRAALDAAGSRVKAYHHVFLAELFLRRGQYDRAIDELARGNTLVEDGHLGPPHLKTLLALSQVAAGKLEESLVSLESATKQTPQGDTIAPGLLENHRALNVAVMQRYFLSRVGVGEVDDGLNLLKSRVSAVNHEGDDAPDYSSAVLMLYGGKTDSRKVAAYVLKWQDVAPFSEEALLGRYFLLAWHYLNVMELSDSMKTNEVRGKLGPILAEALRRRQP
jgi:tetratricopeptide (TPR) repeat protein